MANANRKHQRQQIAVMNGKKSIKISEMKKKKVGKKITAKELRNAFSDFLEKPSGARCVCEGARPRFVRVKKGGN